MLTFWRMNPKSCEPIPQCCSKTFVITLFNDADLKKSTLTSRYVTTLDSVDQLHSNVDILI